MVHTAKPLDFRHPANPAQTSAEPQLGPLELVGQHRNWAFSVTTAGRRYPKSCTKKPRRAQLYRLGHQRRFPATGMAALPADLASYCSTTPLSASLPLYAMALTIFGSCFC